MALLRCFTLTTALLLSADILRRLARACKPCQTYVQIFPVTLTNVVVVLARLRPVLKWCQMLL